MRSKPLEITFVADKDTNTIVCLRRGASTVTYTQDGAHPILNGLSRGQREGWLTAKEELGW